MSLLQENPVQSETSDEFAALVETLRKDFQRLFPHLRPREHECFFVEQSENKSSGKVWIEFIKERDRRPVRCRITIMIERNRAVRRIQEEKESLEALEDTAGSRGVHRQRRGRPLREPADRPD
jgi:hypothetical protein